MKKTVASGTISAKQIRIVVGFDHAQFADIQALAERERRPLSAIVRELVEWGMEEGAKGSAA